MRPRTAAAPLVLAALAIAGCAGPFEPHHVQVDISSRDAEVGGSGCLAIGSVEDSGSMTWGPEVDAGGDPRTAPGAMTISVDEVERDAVTFTVSSTVSANGDETALDTHSRTETAEEGSPVTVELPGQDGATLTWLVAYELGECEG